MQYSVLYYPKPVRHFIITVSSKEELIKKLAEVSHREESPRTDSFQSEDGSVINVKTIDCDSLAFDDFNIELIEE